MANRGNETDRWAGDSVRREAFFFPCGGKQLYGSVYASAEPTSSAGVAICSSWGYEANQSDATIHRIALANARAGGMTLLFHYPGFGDSRGEPAAVTMEDLVDAALGAIEEGTRRLGARSWTLVGAMFGASVAALAASRAEAARLLLLQPVLESTSYFARLERSARRAAIRVPARVDNAYGYPLPRRILEAAPAIDSAVAAALSEFAGEGAVVRYATPSRDERIPAGFEDIVLPGTWRFGARQKPELAEAAAGWLQGAGMRVAE